MSRVLTRSAKSEHPSDTRWQWALAGILLVQAVLLGWAAGGHSPCNDEVGHMAAGLHHWETGNYALYAVNPPLVRLVATAPLAAAGVELPPYPPDPVPAAREEFDIGERFVTLHGENAFRYFVAARLTCLPFALFATAVVFAWGRALYGPRAGLLAAALWAADPNQLANGQMITPDTAAAGFGLAACYLFWRWVRRPQWATALAAGAVLGAAELCKTTWLVLGPVWVVGWLVCRGRRPRRAAEGGQLAAAFLAAAYIISAGYGFEGVATPLGEFPFVSRALARETPTGERVNRFAGTWAEAVPVPAPRNYVLGIDAQKAGFEARSWSYLRGEWRQGGWWYYYFYGLLVKTPIGSLVVAGMAAATYALQGGPRPGWRDEFVLFLPAVAVIATVSASTGFNRHLRYVLPAVPFVAVWVGRAAEYSGPYARTWRWGVGAATAATVASSLSVYPHSMSYFNEVAGGPMRGGEHLVDSNLDWGQDLLRLKWWYDTHPEARPFHLAYFGCVDPRAAGIEFTLPPAGSPGPDAAWHQTPADLGPRPGWHAVSATVLRGYPTSVPDGSGGWVVLDTQSYTYFGRATPVATAGYSIWIYYLDAATCARIRREVGLPPLPPDLPEP